MKAKTAEEILLTEIRKKYPSSVKEDTKYWACILSAMKEYAKQKCARQRIKVGNELVTWTEDISIPNQRKIHELCQGAEEPEFD